MDRRLRDDVNHLITLLLRWRGWGNFERDPPLQVLWEIASETAVRDVDVSWDEVMDHAFQCFQRAGKPEKAAHRLAREIVEPMSAIVRAAHHQRAGFRQLDHQRTLPVHEACFRDSESRWSTATKRHSWEQGRIVTYTCFPVEDDSPVDYPTDRFPEILRQYLHRDDGPALESYFDGDHDRPEDSLWCTHGEPHRDDGPAIVFRYEDGTPRREIWYQRGLQHRDDGPFETWFPDPSPGEFSVSYDRGHVYGWALHGEEMSFNEFCARVPTEVRQRLQAAPQNYAAAHSYFTPASERHPMAPSLFISYGNPDESFASAINERLKRAGFQTWFFPDDSVPGRRLHRTMSDAANDHDRVVLICSKASLGRPGVLNELEQVLAREAREGGQELLIPIRLDDHVLTDWAPSRSDLARQVRDRVVADFRAAQSDPVEFERQMRRVIEAARVATSR